MIHGWIDVTDRLPQNRTYVLVRYTSGNWEDSDDQNGCVIKVMKFIETGYDRHNPNNSKPYHWESFGPGSFFGQEVDYWMPIPTIEEEK